MSGYRSVALKKKDFSGYTLSGVGVGVNPPLALSFMGNTSTKRTAGAIKYGGPTAVGTGGAQRNGMNPLPPPTLNSNVMSVNDRRNVKAVQSLQHHHIVHTVKTLHPLPITHTKKKHNFMDIFERKK